MLRGRQVDKMVNKSDASDAEVQADTRKVAIVTGAAVSTNISLYGNR